LLRRKCCAADRWLHHDRLLARHDQNIRRRRVELPLGEERTGPAGANDFGRWVLETSRTSADDLRTEVRLWIRIEPIRQQLLHLGRAGIGEVRLERGRRATWGDCEHQRGRQPAAWAHEISPSRVMRREPGDYSDERRATKGGLFPCGDSLYARRVWVVQSGRCLRCYRAKPEVARKTPRDTASALRLRDDSRKTFCFPFPRTLPSPRWGEGTWRSYS